MYLTNICLFWKCYLSKKVIDLAKIKDCGMKAFPKLKKINDHTKNY